MDYKELRRLIILLNEGKDLTDWAKTKLINFVNMEETKQFDIPVVVATLPNIESTDFQKWLSDNEYTNQNYGTLLKGNKRYCINNLLKHYKNVLEFGN